MMFDRDVLLVTVMVMVVMVMVVMVVVMVVVVMVIMVMMMKVIIPESPTGCLGSGWFKSVGCSPSRFRDQLGAAATAQHSRGGFSLISPTQEKAKIQNSKYRLY